MLPSTFLLQCVNEGKFKCKYVETTPVGLQVGENCDVSKAQVFKSLGSSIVPVKLEHENDAYFGLVDFKLGIVHDQKSATTLTVKFDGPANLHAKLVMRKCALTLVEGDDARGTFEMADGDDAIFAIVPVSNKSFGFSRNYFQLECIDGDFEGCFLTTSNKGWYPRLLNRYGQEIGNVFQDDGEQGVSCLGAFHAGHRDKERVGVLQMSDDGARVSNAVASKNTLRVKYEKESSITYLSFYTCDGLPVVLDYRPQVHESSEKNTAYLKCGTRHDVATKFRYHQVYAVAPLASYKAKEFTQTPLQKALPSAFLLQCVSEGAYDRRYIEASSDGTQVLSKDFDISKAQVFKSQGSSIVPFQGEQESKSYAAFGVVDNKLRVVHDQKSSTKLSALFFGPTNSYAKLVIHEGTPLSLVDGGDRHAATLQLADGDDAMFAIVPVSDETFRSPRKYFQLECMEGEFEGSYLATSNRGWYPRVLKRYGQTTGNVFHEDEEKGVSCFGTFKIRHRGKERVGVLQMTDKGAKVSDIVAESENVLHIKHDEQDASCVSFCTGDGLPIVLDFRPEIHEGTEKNAAYLKCGTQGEVAAKFRYHSVFEVAPATFSDREFVQTPLVDDSEQITQKSQSALDLHAKFGFARKYFQLQCAEEQFEGCYLATSNDGWYTRVLKRYGQTTGNVFHDDGDRGVSCFGKFAVRGRDKERRGVVRMCDDGAKVSDVAAGEKEDVLHIKYEPEANHVSFYTGDGLPVVLDCRPQVHDSTEKNAAYLKRGRKGDVAAKFRYHRVFEIAPATFSDREFVQTPFELQVGSDQITWKSKGENDIKAFIVARNLHQNGTSTKALRDLFLQQKENGSFLTHCLTQQTVRNPVEILEFYLTSLHGRIDQPSVSGGASFRQLAMASNSPSVRAYSKEAQLYLGRYVVDDTVGLHRSKTCVVYSAVDVRSSKSSKLVLKVMSVQEHFDREYAVYQDLFNSKHTIEDDPKKHFVELVEAFPDHLCLVLKFATRNLEQVYENEHFAGQYEYANRIFAIMHDLGTALKYMHSHKFMIHGDFKPKNAVRVDGDFKLIDFDASVHFSNNLCELSGKYSSAYAAPEVVRALGALNNRNEIEEKQQQSVGPQHNEVREGNNKQMLDYQTKPSPSPSQDVWSFGVVLYEMCSGDKLFKSNLDDNISSKTDEQRLMNWNGLDESEIRKVLRDGRDSSDKRIVLDNVVELIKSCLENDPAKRPDMDKVCNKLQHLVSSTPEVLEKLHAQVESLNGKIDNRFHELKEFFLDVDERPLPSHWSLIATDGIDHNANDYRVIKWLKQQRENVKSKISTEYSLVLIDEETKIPYVCDNIRFRVLSKDHQKYIEAAKTTTSLIQFALGFVGGGQIISTLGKFADSLQKVSDSEAAKDTFKDVLKNVLEGVSEDVVKGRIGEMVTTCPYQLQVLFDNLGNCNPKRAIADAGFVRIPASEGGAMMWVYRGNNSWEVTVRDDAEEKPQESVPEQPQTLQTKLDSGEKPQESVLEQPESKDTLAKVDDTPVKFVEKESTNQTPEKSENHDTQSEPEYRDVFCCMKRFGLRIRKR